MTKPTYDQDFWETLWSKTLREHGDKVSRRPPNAHLIAEVQRLPPGRAVDAGCGHGAESLWLAAHGWQVTAVDFSSAALAHAQATAEALGQEIAARIEFVQADLGGWSPEPDAYDLVTSLHVHVAGPMEERVRRLGRGVRVGGTLFIVGHQPVDPATGAATAAAGQTQVSLQAALAALAPDAWTFEISEERARPAGGGVDAVISARRVA